MGSLDVTGLTRYKALNPLPPPAAAAAAAAAVVSDETIDLIDNEEQAQPADDNEEEICSPEEVEASLFATHQLEKQHAAAAWQDKPGIELHCDIEAAFWEGEYVLVGQQEECEAFGDDPGANVDLAALLAETFNCT